MGLTVRKALEIKELNRAIVVAGHQGLNNQIEFVNIMEVPEVIRWMKGGELLVTAGYVFKDNELLKKNLIQDLASKKVAALGIKPGKHLPKVPQEMIEQANKIGLPILELPHELPYMEFMIPIFEILMSNQICQLRRAEEIHNSLIEVLLSDGGFNSISACLKTIIGNPVVILDKTGNSLTKTCGPKQEQVFLREFLKDTNHNSTRFLNYNPNRSHRIELKSKGIEQAIVLVPIKASDEVDGFLIVLETKKKLKEQDLRIIEYAGNILALQFVKEKAIFDTERKIKGDLLADLVSGSFNNEKVVIRRASFLNFNLKAPLAVFIVDIDSFERYFISEATRNEDHIQELKSRILHFCHYAFGDYPGNAMLQMKSNNIIGLVRVSDAEDEKLLEVKCNKICEQVRAGYPKISVSIGIGRTYKGVRNIKKSHEEALSSLRIGRSLRGHGNVTFFRDLGAYRFLHELKDSKPMLTFHQELVGKIRQYDKQNKTGFLDTLICYLEKDCNARLAAKELFIHKNTVIYRIKRIEEITGLDLNQNNDKFNLQLSLKLDEFVETKNTSI